jgi:large subunit ribosomal protein L14
MIQVGTFLSVIDNSGAKLACCLRIKSKTKKRYARIGDQILISVKKLRTKRKLTSKVKKGEIYNALIVLSKKENHTKLFKNKKYLSNSIILLNKQNKLIGSKIFGGLPKKFRYTKFLKILFMASGAIR